MAQQMCMVVRPIPGPDHTYQPGETVDVSTWRPRNVAALIARGHLRPAAQDTTTHVHHAPAPAETEHAIERTIERQTRRRAPAQKLD